ncbi:IS607 family transposase [Dehalococcoidales bacterium]|nr:IS607 family transposase [Dehalococcoidales bacterium]
MKLSEYAKKLGISYMTAWRMYRKGEINAYRLPTGTIIVESEEHKLPNKVCIYARVSSSENKSNLDSQAERLRDYAIARGYQIYKVVKEVGSGINDNRTKLAELLKDKGYRVLLVEHKDRLTRFDFNYIKLLLAEMGKEIEVVNETKDDKEDLLQDLIAIIYSFSARLYGLRRAKRKTEKIIEELKRD